MLLGILTTLLLLMALLAIPLTLAFRVNREHSFNASFTFIWLFGLVKVKANRNAKDNAEKKKTIQTDKKHRRSTRTKHSKKQRSEFAKQLFLQPALRKHLLVFLSRLFRAIKRDDISLKLRVGLGDPADTGVLWGYVGPIAGWLNTRQNLSVDILPEFYDNVFGVDGSGKLRLIPLQLVYLIVVLVLSPVVFKSIARARSLENRK